MASFQHRKEWKNLAQNIICIVSASFLGWPGKSQVYTVFLKWVNVEREESKFHDEAAQSWEVKIMLQQSLENMTVKVNQ